MPACPLPHLSTLKFGECEFVSCRGRPHHYLSRWTRPHFACLERPVLQSWGEGGEGGGGSLGGGTLLGLMMFSDNVASAIRETRLTPLANFKEGEGDPYIHSTASGRAVGQVGS